MIYGVPLMLQEKEIEAYCFGSCGKAKLAGIESDIAGPLIPCSETNCKYEEARTPVIGEAFGEEVCIRKLKD